MLGQTEKTKSIIQPLVEENPTEPEKMVKKKIINNLK